MTTENEYLARRDAADRCGGIVCHLEMEIEMMKRHLVAIRESPLEDLARSINCAILGAESMSPNHSIADSIQALQVISASLK